MAKLPNGFFGKFGNVVVVNRGGELHLRSLPKNMPPQNAAQLKQCSTLGLVSSFIAKVKQVADLGFEGTSKKPKHSAVSYNMKYGVDKSGSEAVLDYSNILVTRGDLIKPERVHVSIDLSGDLKVQWIDNSGSGSAKASDRGVIAVYSPELHQAICRTEKGSRRDKEQFIITLPDTYIGKELHIYFSFVSENGKEISDSVYLNYS